MDDVAVARAVHVLAVIHWIGGLTFVTLIVLPLARACQNAKDGLALFQSVERRFAAQVRLSIPLVGATGFWMAYRLDLWSRIVDPHFWWMGAMVGLWAVFMTVLFVIEPRLHGTFEDGARQDPVTAVRRISRVHEVLLALAAVTAFGAVAGTHGLVFF